MEIFDLHDEYPDLLHLWGTYVNADMEVMWLHGLIEDGIYEGDVSAVVHEIFRQQEIHETKRAEYLKLGEYYLIIEKLRS